MLALSSYFFININSVVSVRENPGDLIQTNDQYARLFQLAFYLPLDLRGRCHHAHAHRAPNRTSAHRERRAITIRGRRRRSVLDAVPRRMRAAHKHNVVPAAERRAARRAHAVVAAHAAHNECRALAGTDPLAQTRARERAIFAFAFVNEDFGVGDGAERERVQGRRGRVWLAWGPGVPGVDY